MTRRIENFFTNIVCKLFSIKVGSYRFIRLGRWVHLLFEFTIIRAYRLVRGKSWRKTKDYVENKYDRIAGFYIDNIFYGKVNIPSYGKVDDKIVRRPFGELHQFRMQEMGDILSEYKFSNVLEIGAGELTTLYSMIKRFGKSVSYYALDLSLNRLVVGKKEIGKHTDVNVNLSKADASSLPFGDNAFDLVYTSHCLEHMPYDFKYALKEMARVTKRYIVLFEPSWELGDILQKLSIISANYVRGIPKAVGEMKYVKMTDNYFLRNSSQPITHTACFKLEKDIRRDCSVESSSHDQIVYVCPKCHKELSKIQNGSICENCGRVYFEFEGIPILDINKSFLVDLSCVNTTGEVGRGHS